MQRAAAQVHADDVIVIDAAQRAALVAVRDLGEAGLRVCALDSHPFAPALASRFTACRATVPDVVDDQDAFIDAVLDVCARHRPRVLITSHDGSIEALRRRREEVERVVALALAPEAALAVAVDKRKTLAAADELGVRTPRGVLVKDPSEADAALEEVGLPAVSKPVQSWFHRDGRGMRVVPVVGDDRKTLRENMINLLERGVPLFLQEWLPGDREAVSIFFADGRVWARFAQRAIRTTPPLGGNSVVRESIPLPEDIAADAERLVSAIGLEGYSEVEFRRDADGRPALMELNPRLSASVEIAVRAGVQFPRMLFEWASGGRLEQANGYRTGMRMRWLGGDVSWLKHCLSEGAGPDVPSRGRAIGQFAGDFLRPAGYDYLSRGDLRPALAAAVSSPRRYVRRRGAPSHDGMDTDVAVIGAGPYGLAVSAHLSGAGIAHEIFGQTMDSWANHMPRGMYLKSEGFASNISEPTGVHTLERFCAESDIEYGRIAVPIKLDTFVSYGRWFQERVVPQVRANRVQQVRRLAEGFELELDSGQGLRARRVVAAVGVEAFTFVPPQLRDLPAGTVAHAYHPEQVPAGDGRSLLVLGAGQSALEGAALAHEAGAAVQIVARRAQFAWNSKPGGPSRPLATRLRSPESGLGEGLGQWAYANHPLVFHRAPFSWRREKAFSVLGPAGAWWLKPRIEGQIPTALGRTLIDASADGGQVLLRFQTDNGVEERSADQVLAGTGYRPNVGSLEILEPAIRDELATAEGSPVLDRDFGSSVPDLYFVGYLAAVSFGPLMRFVFGTEFMARRVAGRLRVR